MPNSAGGFKQENETKIDSNIVTLLGNEDVTITTKIISGKNISPARVLLGVSNPYVDICISPPDNRFGNQLQRSSYKPLTVNPVWSPYERFQHTTNITNSKLVFSVYHLRSTNLRSPPSLGDCVLNISEITDEPTTKTLRLYDQKNGSQLDGELTVIVQKTPAKKALRHAEHIVFEYERWQPVIGWGNKSMLPTDPGCYSNEYGTKFARTFNEVSPTIPRGWTVITEFHCLGNFWEYSIDLTRSDWYSEKGQNCFVRRRPWFREIVEADYNKVAKRLSINPANTPTIEGQSETNSNSTTETTITKSTSDTTSTKSSLVTTTATATTTTTLPTSNTPNNGEKSNTSTIESVNEKTPILENTSKKSEEKNLTPTPTPKTNNTGHQILTNRESEGDHGTSPIHAHESNSEQNLNNFEISNEEKKESEVTTAPVAGSKGCCLIM